MGREILDCFISEIFCGGYFQEEFLEGGCGVWLLWWLYQWWVLGVICTGGVEVFLEKRRGDSGLRDCVDWSGLIWSVRGASHQSFFMGKKLLLVTWVLLCLLGEWVSFWVPGALEVDGAWVWSKSGLRYTLLPKVWATLGNCNRVWEKCSC